MDKLTGRPAFALIIAFGAVVLAGFAPAGAAADDKPGNAPLLAEAIDKFNKQAKSDPVGKEQPPLTKEEVVAAIRIAQRAAFPTDPLYGAFKRIADTEELPLNAHFDVLNLLDGGESFVFDVWYVRLGLQTDNGGAYYFS